MYDKAMRFLEQNISEEKTVDPLNFTTFQRVSGGELAVIRSQNKLYDLALDLRTFFHASTTRETAKYVTTNIVSLLFAIDQKLSHPSAKSMQAIDTLLDQLKTKGLSTSVLPKSLKEQLQIVLFDLNRVKGNIAFNEYDVNVAPKSSDYPVGAAGRLQYAFDFFKYQANQAEAAGEAQDAALARKTVRDIQYWLNLPDQAIMLLCVSSSEDTSPEIDALYEKIQETRVFAPDGSGRIHRIDGAKERHNKQVMAQIDRLQYENMMDKVTAYRQKQIVSVIAEAQPQLAKSRFGFSKTLALIWQSVRTLSNAFKAERSRLAKISGVNSSSCAVYSAMSYGLTELEQAAKADQACAPAA